MNFFKSLVLLILGFVIGIIVTLSFVQDSTEKINSTYNEIQSTMFEVAEFGLNRDLFILRARLKTSSRFLQVYENGDDIKQSLSKELIEIKNSLVENEELLIEVDSEILKLYKDVKQELDAMERDFEFHFGPLSTRT
ncbi:hypothetical protein J3L16_15535 [Alteromonas sp. 5E99-2]|uniref:hypothetical protein n=1 Tax=Alteromonas sp. 5E99-2 TaxID=2817683 RepID=UPI001A988833|nr:hypothetical protein [Alteromonas sp. 5E99-2]MBO1257096.1 hypothetical protein [Alteromonas sp. 5E99-2]